MKKFLRILLYIIAILAIVYLFGPTPEKASYEKTLPAISAPVEEYVKQIESKHKIKPGNEAEIVWANDSFKQKTEYTIVYLHGFTASKEEGNPVHKNIAKEFGCNLYLSRLAEHGLDTTEPLINLTAEKYWQSVKEALAIGKQLGNKIILMGTSTGGTNALQLAAAYPDDIVSVILLSPNIEINDPNAWVANNHWGLQIAHLVMKGDYVDSKDQRDIFKKYWYSHYRLEGVSALQEMLETSMTKETFEKVKQPALLLYYYKDDIHQDSVVKVSVMLKMYDELASVNKRKVAMPNTGDHVLGSPIKSHDVEGVQREIEKFMKEVLQLKPVQ
ncbi:MAG: alpha/beta hydrolase [Sphingobacteriales bacterium]|nr:alpha/beta hydrolase [Sphingobacteriales bacterium]MBI3717900.1 alpha/beta hydrolase [Sphingobacteriales bacterium]